MRKTSIYRLSVPGAGKELDKLLPHLTVTDRGVHSGRAQVSYRTTDDLAALMLASTAVLKAGLSIESAEVHTGFGVNRRKVSK